MTQNIYDNAEFFRQYSGLRRSIGGFGWFCRWARQHGAAHVLGIDISEKMLARAVATTDDTSIAYNRADMEHLELAPGSFDLVYSSLAFHYIVDLDRLFGEVHRSLVPGGSFIFSVEHPIYTAPAEPGWSQDDTGRKTWPVSGYLIEGPRTTDWLAKGVIKQHRIIGTYINLLLRLGFAISHVEEWCPTDAQVTARPDLTEERERPMFLLVSAVRG